MSFLSPSVVAAIDDLELVARRIVEGIRAGSNRSPFHGFSSEFRQHRPYRAGDDLKYLDWKLYGRSDRLYTRQFHETTELSVMIVLDTSGSMAFPEHELSKFRYGAIIAAALAYLASDQGNRVGVLSPFARRATAFTLGARTNRPARAQRCVRRSACHCPRRTIDAATRGRDRDLRFLRRRSRHPA